MASRARVVGAVAAASIAVAWILVGVPMASAGTTCTGDIVSATLADGVVVPPGATCELINTTVNGSVQVNAGASITIVGGTVNGSFNATGAHDIRIGDCAEFGCPNRPTVIKGSVYVTGTTGVPSFPTQNVICDATVTGAYVVIQNNQAPFAIGALSGQCNVAGGDTIGGSLIVAGNTAAIRLQANHIAGVLSCTSNTPPPVNGGGNTAQAKSGQCAGF